MATSKVTPENALATALGKLHPDYDISIFRPVSDTYPYIRVTVDKYEVGIRIMLAGNHWSVAVLDRLVVKAIKRIEDDNPKPSGNA